MIVGQNKRKATDYGVPSGGEILWYGVAANVPTGYVIDSYCANVFVRGAAAGGASNTPASDNSHTHTNPAATGSDPNHTHPIGGGGTGGATGSTAVFGPGGGSAASGNHNHDIPSGTSGAAGAHTHTLAGAASASAYPPYARLYWIKSTQEAALPVGGIVMWDNPIASAPDGCVLCNGSGGTPDLRDKFVYGAAADGDLGATGGSATHVHANANTGDAGAHTHSLAITSGGASGSASTGTQAGTSVASDGHSHGLNGTSDSQADHSHTIGNTGAASSLPVYLKVYFVMRTS
jgi:hypothetical protein